jgi:hypothetical protein
VPGPAAGGRRRREGERRKKGKGKKKRGKGKREGKERKERKGRKRKMGKREERNWEKVLKIRKIVRKNRGRVFAGFYDFRASA